MQVQFSCSVMSDSLQPRGLQQSFLSITNSPEVAQTPSVELVMPSSYLIICRPLLPLPSIFPSIRVFSYVQDAGLSAGAQKSYPVGAHRRMSMGKELLTVSLMIAGIGRNTVMWEQGGHWKEDWKGST